MWKKREISTVSHSFISPNYTMLFPKWALKENNHDDGCLISENPMILSDEIEMVALFVQNSKWYCKYYGFNAT